MKLILKLLICTALGLGLSSCSFSESQKEKSMYVIEPCIGLPEDQVVDCLQAQVEELYVEAILEELEEAIE